MVTSPERPRARLLMLDGPTPGRLIDVGPGPLLIGRSPDCDLVLKDQYKAVSSQHARIRFDDGAYEIEDLRSLNRTEVDGQILQGEARSLRNGSRIRIVNHHFLFYLNDDDSAKIRGMVDPGRSGTGEYLKVRPEEKLRAVLDICHAVGSARDPQAIVRKALDRLFDIFPQADEGIVLVSGEGGTQQVARVREGEDARVRYSRTIYQKVLNEGKAILCEDIVGEFGLAESIDFSRIFMLMCVPLLDHDRKPFGMIQVDTSRRRGSFTQDDLDLLTAVAGPVGIFVENAMLQRLGGEIEQAERDAREFQQALLPVARPELPGYDFWDFYQPAEFVGGDCFDYLPFPTRDADEAGAIRRWAVVVGDVAGKGMAAAKQMARLSTVLRQALLTETGVAAVVRKVNRDLCRFGDADRYVTLLLGVLDVRAHTLTVVRAGHPAPLIRRAAGGIEIGSAMRNALLLGFDPDAEYGEVVIHFEPGDVVVFFSDGITEAMDRSSRWFGDDRLRQTIEQVEAGPKATGEAILREVRGFVGGDSQSDDITLVCFGRKAE